MKILFYSNPKTGTSTVEFNFKNFLGEDNVCIINHPSKFFDDYNDTKVKNLLFISGHRFNLRRFLRIKSLDKKFFLFTLFREPAEQIISAYNYDLNMKYKFFIPFWVWYYFLIPKNPQCSHFYRRFHNQFFKSFFLNKKFFKSTLNKFELFDKIILTENIDNEVPALINSVMGKNKLVKLIQRKKTGLDYKKYKKLTPKLRNLLNKKNSLDFKLYKHFKNNNF